MHMNEYPKPTPLPTHHHKRTVSMPPMCHQWSPVPECMDDEVSIDPVFRMCMVMELEQKISLGKGKDISRVAH